MYNTTGATLRGDLNILVEEASGADKLFIAPQVMPMLGVETKSGQYPKLAKATGGLLELGSTLRSEGGSYGETNRAWTSDTYDCIDRGLEERVDDANKKDIGRFFDLESATAKFVLRAMSLDYENRVQAAIMNASNFGAGTGALVAYTQANIATIDLPGDVIAAQERLADNGVNGDTIVMSANLFNRVIRSTMLQNFVRGNRPTDSTMNMTTEAVAQAFAANGIKQVLVGRARYNSAKKGAAYVKSCIWGDTYIWVGQCNGGAATDGGAGRTFVWNAEGGLFVTETYRDEKRRSNMVRVRQNTIEKIIDGSAGTLITTSYA